MPTILSASFQSALAKLTNEERKQTELTAFQLMSDPNRPGLQFHRIDKSRDPNFWSVRVNRAQDRRQPDAGACGSSR